MAVDSGVTGRIALEAAGLAPAQRLHDPSGTQSGPTGSLAPNREYAMQINVPANEKALVVDVAPRMGRQIWHFSSRGSATAASAR